MDILKIPTDSLYKFMAIFGAVAFLIFLCVPEYIVYHITAEAIGSWGEGCMLKADIDANNQNLLVLEAVAKQVKKNGVSKKDMELLHKVKERNIAIKKRLIREEVNMLLLNHKNNSMKHWRRWQLTGTIFSLLIMVSGFVLWYIKVQRPLDKTNRVILPFNKK